MATHKDSVRSDQATRAMREAAQLPRTSIVDIDPEDPAQLLDDVGQFSVVDLEVEAQPSAEADAELDAAVMTARAGEGEDEDNVSEVDDDARELDTPDQTTADAYVDSAEDVGDLYGVHTPRAEDRDLDKSDDQEDFIDSEQGEHWLETLGKKAAEYGAEEEHEVEVIDDSDEHRGHHKSDTRDRPVADKGSGGHGGT